MRRRRTRCPDLTRPHPSPSPHPHGPQTILDIGCSVGLSSRYLATAYPQAQVTGLDLSPYMLAVGELRERQLGGGAGQRQRIRYIHGDMEHSGLPDASFDMVSVQFVCHELPGEVIARLVSAGRGRGQGPMEGLPPGAGASWVQGPLSAWRSARP